jgi:hypothetical protein
MADKTTLYCGFPGGVELQLCELRDEGYTGLKQMVRVGDPVVIPGPGPGSTEHVATDVDAAFLDAWLKQNEKNPLVLSGVLHVQPPDRDADDAEG